MEEGDENGEGFKLDVVVAASGFGNKEQQILSEVTSNLTTSRSIEC